MNEEKRSAQLSNSRLFHHPLTFLLSGAGATIPLVRWYFTLSASMLWIAGLITLLLSGLIVTKSKHLWSRLGLAFIGAGMFGLYAIGCLLSIRVVRQQLLNERIHLRGIYQGEGRLTSSTINNQPVERDFYIPEYVVSRSMENGNPDPRLSLTLTGVVKWPHASPGFASYLERAGYLGYLEVKRVHSRSRAPPQIETGLRDHLVESFSGVKERWPQSVSFLRALILGNKQALARHDRVILKRLGLIHLFVISGLHVMILFALFRGVLEPFGDWMLLGGTVVALLGYLWFLGWPVSATRASLMIVVFVGLDVAGRRTTRWSSLFTAMLVMMVFNPFVVLDPGFQLTVSAVAGIFISLRYANQVRFVPGLDYVVVSTGAFLGVLPILLYHFHYIPALGSVFAALATAIFPLFFGLVVLQWGLIELRWTAMADFLESVFSATINGLGWVARNVGYLSVTDISLVTVLLLAGGLFLTMALDRQLLIRFVSMIVVLILLMGVLGSRSQPHLEVRLIADRPVVIQTTMSGTANLLVPRYVRFKPHHVEELGRILRRKGVRHVKRLVSDYPRTVFEQLDPNFTVGEFHVHWRRDDEVNFERGSYDFSKATLDVPRGPIQFDVPPSIDLSGYQPGVLVGRQPDQRCFLNDVEQLEDRVYEQIQAMPCEKVLLRETHVLINTTGHRVGAQSLHTSVEEWFLAHLLRVKR